MQEIRRVKYPRTFHLPYSETITDDDKRLYSDDDFWSMECVMTQKMDGENSVIYPDGYLHARSIDGNKHPWQAWLKKYIQSWCYDIPEGWRVCGENLYPRHSIAYKFPDESYFFQVFGIYDENDYCLSWIETENWCKLLGIRTVPVIWKGRYEDATQAMHIFDEYKQKNLRETGNEVEGFVLRTEDGFSTANFSPFNPPVCIAKYVRKNHVTTDAHWTEHWTKNEVIA